MELDQDFRLAVMSFNFAERYCRQREGDRSVAPNIKEKVIRLQTLELHVTCRFEGRPMHCKRLPERDRQINEIVLRYLCGASEIGVIRNPDGKTRHVVILDV